MAATKTPNLDDDTWPPGVRFHPTDEELILYYLKRKISGRKLNFDCIAVVDIYKSEPQELPGLSVLKNRDRQWFFFSPVDRKYPNGSRANRATRQGYWKATGRDRTIICNSRNAGVKKTLVFYEGRAPNGRRTDWVMHEYMLEEDELKRCQNVHGYYVIYKVFKKSGPGPKNGEQYGAPFKEEDWAEDDCPKSSSSCDQLNSAQQVLSVSPSDSCWYKTADPLVNENDKCKVLNSVPDEPAPRPLPVNIDDFEQALLHVDPLANDNHQVLNRVLDEPAPGPLPYDDFEQALSEFLGEEDNQSTVTNPSYEEAKKPFVFDDDYIEMDDLFDPEPVQVLSSVLPQPTSGETPDYLRFEDGLSEYDLFYDTDAILCDMEPNIQKVPPAQYHRSQEYGSFNQRKGLSFPGNDLWTYDSTFCHVNSTESNGSSHVQSSGVLNGGMSASELNHNQEAESSQPWSSTLWSFVESIPAAPASAAESALLNKAFHRMSSFGRLRINSNKPISAAARNANKSSSAGVGGRTKGYFLFSFLAALFAVVCVFIGSNSDASVFGRLYCR